MLLKQRFTLAILILGMALPACNSLGQEGSQSPVAPVIDATKITLEIQGTALAGVLTQQANEAATQVPAPVDPTDTQSTEELSPQTIGKFVYTGEGVINVLSEDGAVWKELPIDKLYANGATWSQDGTQIIFFGQPAPGPRPDGKGDFYIVDEDGANLIRLTNTPTEPKGMPSLSPDGQYILYANGGGVEVVKIDGTDIREVVPRDGHSWVVTANWSPNGNKIVYLKVIPDCDNCLQTARLIVINRDGSASVTVHTTEPKKGITLLVSSPSWSPDGTQIGFEDSSEYVVDVDGTDQPRLSTESIRTWLPSYWPQWGEMPTGSTEH